MRSKQLLLERYKTDKISNGYLEWYDPIFQHLVDQEVTVLEIGVKEGGSLLLWRDYFPKGKIIGIDLELPPILDPEERIKIFRGSQDNKAFLSEVAQKSAPDGFDVIIDDASHIGELTKISFWHLFDNFLKPSGIYVIEDWGTGYWDDWPDGKKYQPKAFWRSLRQKIPQFLKRRTYSKAPWPSHSYGMVGFIKELIDEQGMADLTKARIAGTPERIPKFEKMVIMPTIVFITKRVMGII